MQEARAKLHHDMQHFVNEVTAEELDEIKKHMENCDESDKQNFDVGTSGEISLILEEHKNVLTLPVDAVHNADGKNYVYPIHHRT